MTRSPAVPHSRMPPTDQVDAATSGETTSWRETAVARSLNPARERAEKRVQRFLDAAMELLLAGDGSEFTVQAVVDASGQSLRSFYQYFGGKHELLMALFEEAVLSTTEHLREHAAAGADPVERLHRFVVECHRLCRPPQKTKRKRSSSAAFPVSSPVLTQFAHELLTARPAEAAQVFQPVVRLFEELLGEAIDAGAVRADLDRRCITGIVLESIMFNAFSATIAGMSRSDDAAAEELWALLFRGLAV